MNGLMKMFAPAKAPTAVFVVNCYEGGVLGRYAANNQLADIYDSDTRTLSGQFPKWIGRKKVARLRVKFKREAEVKRVAA